MEQVTSFEARPPRQYDDGIPKELDRICLKALSKRASERYSTAKDMADDLRHFLAEQTLEPSCPKCNGPRHAFDRARVATAIHRACIQSILRLFDDADLGPAADQDRAERLAVVRRPRRRLLPRTVAGAS